MLFLVINAVALICLVQLHEKTPLPFSTVSTQRQPIESAIGSASLWQVLTGGLGAQQMQF